MKKTSKRIIATVLAVVMTLSVYAIGAVSIASLLQPNKTTQTADGSNIINANSIDEAIELMESNPEFFAAPAGTAKATPDSVVYPTIIIPGISQSISYLADEDGYPAYNSNGEELSGGLFILDTSNLIPTIVNNLAAPLVRSLINERDAYLPIKCKTAPFYPWSDFCKYVNSNVKYLCDTQDRLLKQHAK